MDFIYFDLFTCCYYHFGITIGVVVNKNKEKNLTYDLVYKFESGVTGTIPENVKLHEGEKYIFLM